jgi:hypothetical protein
MASSVHSQFPVIEKALQHDITHSPQDMDPDYATSRKVAGSIPDKGIGFFN